MADILQTALFVCFGGMSHVGTLTGLAGLEAMRRVKAGRAGIFCLGGLPTGAPAVLEKTRSVERIVTVDGCQLNCARKIVETAGFRPAQTITLVQDCHLKKGPPTAYDQADVDAVVDAILKAFENGTQARSSYSESLSQDSGDMPRAW